MKLGLIHVFLLLALPTVAFSLVIGIDFGAEWFEVGLVGYKTLDLVLNDQSSRKTPTAVSFDRDDLLIGVDAKNVLTRKPQSVITNIHQLLGREYGDEEVEKVMKFFQFPLAKHESGRFGIPHKNTTFIPEEIAAILLTYAKDIANKASPNPIKDAVITVPHYWTQFQRQAIIDAAAIANIHVLSLINEPSAVGFQFGLEREFTEEPVNMILYDMGSCATTVSLLTFRSLKDGKKNKTVGQVQIQEVAWDKSLGGQQFDHRLADYFVAQIKKDHKKDFSAKENPKAYARLLSQAQKTKEILSANTETVVSVEGLVPDFDFQTRITRKQFEDMSRDLLDRVLQPVEEVLSKAELKPEEIRYAEIFGGGVRVPRIQQILAKYFGRTDMDKHLNGDEAAVMGATFYAATQSSAFNVKDFRIKDVTPYAVSVTVQSDSGDLDKSAELFKVGNRLGSKKSLTFPTTENFTLSLYYEPSPELPTKRYSLGVWEISGIPDETKYNMTAKPKVHISCRLNTNGIVVVEKVEVEINAVYYTPVKVNKTEEKKEEAEQEASTEEKEEAPSSEEPKEEPVSEESKEEAPKEEATPEEKEEPKEETPKDEEAPKEEAKEEEVEMKPKHRVHRIPLAMKEVERVGMTPKEIRDSKAILREIYRRVEIKREREREQNNLEAYIYTNREKVSENEDVHQVSTEEERETFLADLSAAEDWIYETTEETPASEYRKKLRELKTLGDKIYLRLSELEERPIAVNFARESLTTTKGLAANLSEALGSDDKEVQDLVEAVASMEEWLTGKEAEQAKLQAHEDPVLLSQDVYLKWKAIEMKFKSLVRKLKRKPKVKPEDIKKEEKVQEEAQETKEEAKEEVKEEVEEEVKEKVNEEVKEEAKEEAEQIPEQKEPEVDTPQETEEHKHDEL